MNAPARLAAFIAVLAVVFGTAAAAGSAMDPIHVQDPIASSGDHGGDEPMSDAHGASPDEAEAGSHDMPAVGGLAVVEGDLRLVVDAPLRAPGEEAPFTFRIVGPDGTAVTDFDPEQGGVALHLVIVGRDLSGFQHLHPEMDSDGTWSTALSLPAPGVFRAFTDVTVDGQPHTLGTDLFVPGVLSPQPLPAPEDLANVDGYQVTKEAGQPIAGEELEVRFTVSRDGAPVSDLEPYLGARGHLVGLREGDLAYLHLHPEDEAAASGEIVFAGSFPSPGRYRLFLQFQHEGAVQTVAYTVEVSR